MLFCYNLPLFRSSSAYTSKWMPVLYQGQSKKKPIAAIEKTYSSCFIEFVTWSIVNKCIGRPCIRLVFKTVMRLSHCLLVTCMYPLIILFFTVKWSRYDGVLWHCHYWDESPSKSFLINAEKSRKIQQINKMGMLCLLRIYQSVYL